MGRIQRVHFFLTSVMLERINGYLRSTALTILVCDGKILNQILAYPALRSLRRSIKMSKSIELGASKSYSFLVARSCCSGVKTL